MIRIISLIVTLCITPLLASGAKIQSGPMLGYANMAEALIIVQTDSPAKVHVEYWPQDARSDVRKTDPIITEKRTAFIAKCVADQVEAGTNYGYAVYIDGKKQSVKFRKGYKSGSIPMVFHTPKNWRYRETGHQPFDFTVGFGSCAYINEEAAERELRAFEGAHCESLDTRLVRFKVGRREKVWGAVMH